MHEKLLKSNKPNLASVEKIAKIILSQNPYLRMNPEDANAPMQLEFFMHL